MPRFAANLTMLYGHLPFQDRIAAAAQDGFAAVECLFPYEVPAARWRELLQSAGVQQVLFNAPPGAWDQGERGLACLPEREADFRDSVRVALDYAHAIGCPRVHVMAGLVAADLGLANAQKLYEERLAWACDLAEAAHIDLLIEPLNARDVPGYLLGSQRQAHDTVQRVGSVRLKVQMDLYHCQISEGDLAMKLQTWLPTGQVGHLQIAGVPERHEPDVGEIHYPYLFELIDRLGYAGWIGCEYRPKAGTTEGLGWFQRASSIQSA